MIFSTCFGGSADDKPRGIAVDGRGNVLITGRVDSSDFPLARPLQGVHGGQGDIFVSRFTPAGGQDFSTFWGGATTEKGRAPSPSTDAATSTLPAIRSPLTSLRSTLSRAASPGAGICSYWASVPRWFGSTRLSSEGQKLMKARRSRSIHTAVAGFTKSLAFPVVQSFQGMGGARFAASELFPGELRGEPDAPMR